MHEILMSPFPNLSGRQRQGTEGRPLEVPSAPKIARGEEGGPLWREGTVRPQVFPSGVTSEGCKGQGN